MLIVTKGKAMFNNIEFDDYIVGSDGTWSQVCQKCVDDHKFDDSLLDNCGTGLGVCGVKGCDSDSEYYIDFP